jgi:hypothetical protein
LWFLVPVSKPATGMTRVVHYLFFGSASRDRNQSTMDPKACSFFIAVFTFSAELEDDVPVALGLRRYDLLRTRERAVAKVPVHLERTT